MEGATGPPENGGDANGVRAVQTAALERAMVADDGERYLVLAAALEGTRPAAEAAVDDGDAATAMLTPTLVSLAAAWGLDAAGRTWLPSPGPNLPAPGVDDREQLRRAGARLAVERLDASVERVARATGVPASALER